MPEATTPTVAPSRPSLATAGRPRDAVVDAPATPDFDLVVVGAGPAGAAAALVAARAGLRVCLLERGPFPGAKNMYGGVIYARILDDLIPNWWDEAPVQRWVTRRATVVLTESQALTIDFRSSAWGEPPYNGATAFRPDFDAWLAGKAEAAGATVVTSTTATGLLRDGAGHICGVRTDRPDGDLTARLVVACDGVNSFLAKQAGLYHHEDPKHFTLGAKEVLALPRDEVEKRFVLSGREGADFEIIGGTRGIPGGGFIYTNLDSIAIGVVLGLDGLRKAKVRPEELIADLKRHPMIAPLVDGAQLQEYSAHLIPEAGLEMMPELSTDGMLVAGDAAAMCLAAGIWLEGVNFAIGSGIAAGETAVEAVRRGDVSDHGLAGYRRRLESNFVLRDHTKLRRAPSLVMSERVQQRYPQLTCDLVEALFTVTNPEPKQGAFRAARHHAKRSGVRLRDLARDGWTALRTYG
ncbi:MAG: FAD-dependent oxidoreductase [Acidimicrobiales bacterium]|jgi:electron transfer flavoprotein-quinone oxidoreductase|nr:FAD-dependent oxidoreductase [Acidimicrobiales bacterium]